jgi:hypothetical protein
MDDRTVEELIEELRALRVRENLIITQLETRVRDQAVETPPRTTRQVTHEFVTTVNGFTRGDRIRITNKVRKPATWNNDREWTEERERTATVTRVRTDQIHFITDNGVETWRAPNNVRKI